MMLQQRMPVGAAAPRGRRCVPAARPTASPLGAVVPRRDAQRSSRRAEAVATKAMSWEPLFALAEAKPGSVDAPIGVIVGGALFVTVVFTFLIPAYLNRGQQAAQDVFEMQEYVEQEKKKREQKK